MPALPLRASGLASGLATALVAASLSGCGGCREQNIVAEGGPADAPFTDDWGQWLSMAALPDGAPAVAYYNKTRGGLGLATGSFDADGAVSWEHEQVDGFTSDEGLDVGDRGTYASLAVAGDGTLWIAYRDQTLGTLRVASRTADAAEWTSAMAEAGGGASPSVGMFASIALNASSQPVVAHYDQGKGQLRVVRGDGTTFTGEVVDEGEPVAADTAAGTEAGDADVGMFARLRIVSGVEYIAYYDAANGQLKLAWGGTGNYTIEVVDDGSVPEGSELPASSDVGQWPDLMVVDGQIHIAYHDVANQDLRYAVGTPGDWTVTTVDTGEYVGADTALFLSGSAPAVAYFDGRNNDMKLAWRSGDTWQSDTVAGSTAALGFHNEVLTSNGHTYAACYDYTNRSLWFSALN
jgi:hypothetical protein